MIELMMFFPASESPFAISLRCVLCLFVFFLRKFDTPMKRMDIICFEGPMKKIY